MSRIIAGYRLGENANDAKRIEVLFDNLRAEDTILRSMTFQALIIWSERNLKSNSDTQRVPRLLESLRHGQENDSNDAIRKLCKAALQKLDNLK